MLLLDESRHVPCTDDEREAIQGKGRSAGDADGCHDTRESPRAPLGEWYCCRDAGHAGMHVAANDAGFIVATWGIVGGKE